MATTLISLGVIVTLAIGVLLGIYWMRIDQALVVRLELASKQRRAEADIQRQMQLTMQQLFDAARRQV